MLYIGVDLGTSAVKLLLMDEKGEIKKSFPKNMSRIFHIQDGLSRNRKTGTVSLWKESKN
mgnify:CR=1 FL=1